MSFAKENNKPTVPKVYELTTLFLTGGQDTDDNLNSQRDLWPRIHHKTFPVHVFLLSRINLCLFPALFSTNTRTCAQCHYVDYDRLRLLHSPVRLTPAVLSLTSVCALMSTSWWGWTWKGTVMLQIELTYVVIIIDILSEDTVFCRRKAMKGRLYFASKAQKEGKIMIRTHPCAQIFCCDICGFEKVPFISFLEIYLQGEHITTGWHCNPIVAYSRLSCHSQARMQWVMCVVTFLQVDAEQYYSELEEKRTDEFNAEKNRIAMKRLGIAFVTFRDERMTAVWVNGSVAWGFVHVGSSHHINPATAGSTYTIHWEAWKQALLSATKHPVLFYRIVKDYSRVHCRRRPQQSSITTVVQSHKWGVSYAPAPNDIIWSVKSTFSISIPIYFLDSTLTKYHLLREESICLYLFSFCHTVHLQYKEFNNSTCTSLYWGEEPKAPRGNSHKFSV